MNTFILITSLVLGILVFNDAKKMGAEKFTKNGITYLSPLGWAFACALLWIILPFYLVRRREYMILNGVDANPSNFKRNVLVFFGAVVVCFALFVAYILSDKAALLAPQVEESIRSTFKDNPEFSNLEINSLDLVHKSGNDYEGVLSVSEDGKKRTMRIAVIFDGERFIWNTVR